MVERLDGKIRNPKAEGRKKPELRSPKRKVADHRTRCFRKVPGHDALDHSASLAVRRRVLSAFGFVGLIPP
jgi:hypothetical protein